MDELFTLHRLGELDRYVTELSKLQTYSLDDLTTDMAKAWAVSHGLQLAIQAVLDIGNHILAGQGVHAVDYADVIDKLGETGILPAGFARKIRGMAGLRNIIVHEYTRLDMQKLHWFLQNNLRDFADFACYITDYLEKRAAGN